MSCFEKFYVFQYLAFLWLCFRLGTLRKEVRKRERQLQEKKEMKLKLSQESKDKTKKLGKLKYEEPDLEVKLSDELVGSLREVKVGKKCIVLIKLISGKPHPQGSSIVDGNIKFD